MSWVCKKCGGEVVAHTSYTVTYTRPIKKDKSRPIVSMKNETKFNLTREKNFGFVGGINIADSEASNDIIIMLCLNIAEFIDDVIGKVVKK